MLRISSTVANKYVTPWAAKQQRDRMAQGGGETLRIRSDPSHPRRKPLAPGLVLAWCPPWPPTPSVRALSRGASHQQAATAAVRTET